MINSYQANADDQGDPNFDWEGGRPIPGTAADPSYDVDSYEIPEVTASARDADEIQQAAQDREFRQVEPGDHELVVAGFLRAPEPVHRSGYVNGQQVTWSAHKVGVRLAKVDDPQATVLDFFDLPPADPRQLSHYLNASKDPDGRNPGFMSEKFGHFISRLGWPYPKGAPLPAEARRLGNWKGRRVRATVEQQREGQVRINQQTGEPYPPRTQVKLFSYRPSEATVMGRQPGPAPRPGAAPRAAQPAGGRPAPAANQPRQAARAAVGLDEI